MSRNVKSLSMMASTLLLFLALPVTAQQPVHSHGQGETRHQDSHGAMDHQSKGQVPVLGGQDAFAAIQEIVAILQDDAETDWSRVNISALHEHLIDMNRVTLDAHARSEEVEGGARHRVTGDNDRTIAAIHRMVTAHAAWMDGSTEWSAETTREEDGINLLVTSSDPEQQVRIRALGFMGFMALGNHHQPHHLRMARGEAIHPSDL